MAQQDLAALGITRSVEEQVLFLAGQAQQAGLDGVVCSAQEAAQLKSQIPLTTGEQEFLLVTPGIRPADAAADDQRRTLTPQQALAAGGNYLVVGRPVTQADDPRAALQALIASLHV